jgi:hypothetical protein
MRVFQYGRQVLLEELVNVAAQSRAAESSERSPQ